MVGIEKRKKEDCKLKKGVAIDIDHRVMKQQYTPLLPLNGIKGGRKTSCMACQQKKKKERRLLLIFQLKVEDKKF